MNNPRFRFTIFLGVIFCAGFLTFQVVTAAPMAGENNNPQPTPPVQPANRLSEIPTIDFSQSPQDDSDGISRYVANLAAGDTITFTYQYTVPEVVFNRGDILFVFDRTGSMGGEISTAKTAAIDIMNNIRLELPYAWFGVGSFMDYPGYFSYPGYAGTYGSAGSGDLPWIPGIELTENITEVATTINNLTLGWGADTPEDYTRALHETRFSGWRADSKKTVVLFGDAPTHDLDFAGYNFGGDPGVDGIALTDDDLDFETVVGQLAADDISVIAVDSGYSSESEATFKGMSIGFAGLEGTQGLYYNLSDTTQLPAMVVELIRAETSSIDHLTINYTPQYASWVNTEPSEYEDITSGESVEFTLRVTVPDGTEPGFYPFVGVVEGDGHTLRLIYIEITVPGADGDMDLGFNPGVDGYSFVNFGDSSSWYRQLPWEMFQQFFGADQVLHANGDRIGMAQYFYDDTYKGIGAGGHCDGFSATSILNFEEISASIAGRYALPHQDTLFDANLNASVRDALSFGQGQQSSTEIAIARVENCDAVDNSPAALFRYIKSLFENNQPAVIGIRYHSDVLDKEVGHSLLPYRLVEDSAHSRNYIYVYDSNDPKEWWDTEHRIEINTEADTWSYDTASLWFVGYETVSGDSSACKLHVTPMDMYLHKGVPLWEVSSARNTNRGSELGAIRAFKVTGPLRLLFMDDSNRRFGWQDGIYYEEIPGTGFIPASSGISQVGGTYILPDNIIYNLLLSASDIGTGELTYWHGNSMLGMSNITLQAGLQSAVMISPDDTQITLLSLDGAFETDVIANHLRDSEDISVEIHDLDVGDGNAARLQFGPGTDPAFGDVVILSTNNIVTDTIGLALVHRGGDGYSAFSSSAALLPANAASTIQVSDWQDLATIDLLTDEDGDGLPDSTQTLVNTSQATSLTLQADRLQVIADETIQVIAMVTDQLGLPAANGVPVVFSTTLGQLSIADGETSGGVIRVDLSAGGRWGVAAVTATVPGTELSTTIDLVFTPHTLNLPVVIQ